MSLSRWGLVALFSLTAVAAHAEEPPSVPSDPDACLKDDLCRAHYTVARELSKAGNLWEALAAYEAAYERQAVPILLFNIARLHHRLKNYKQAVSSYRRYLQTNAASEASQRSRAQDLLLEALQGLEESPPPAKPVPEPPGNSLVPDGSRATPPPVSQSVPGTAPVPSQSSALSPPAAQPPPTRGGSALASTTASPAVLPQGLQRTPVTPPMAESGWLTARRRLQLGVGLGLVGVFGAVAIGTGVGALHLNAEIPNAIFSAPVPSEDVQRMQTATRSLAAVADATIAASAVSLAVTLVVALRRQGPSAPMPVAGSHIRRD